MRKMQKFFQIDFLNMKALIYIIIIRDECYLFAIERIIQIVSFVNDEDFASGLLQHGVCLLLGFSDYGPDKVAGSRNHDVANGKKVELEFKTNLK